MNITKDVIRDLIPVYLADEASPDTQALVKEYLATDPELAAEVARAQSSSVVQIPKGGEDMTPSPNHELETLLNTRKELAHRSWNLGLALAFTLFPFSFVFAGNHIQWMLLRDVPSAAMASWAASAGFWIGYAIHRRRLQRAGL